MKGGDSYCHFAPTGDGLFATTALVMTAGVAAAEVSLSGSAQMGIEYLESATAGAVEFTPNVESYMTFSGSVTTDGGLELGSSFTIATYNGTDLANDGSNVYISGAFGKLTFGDVAEADQIGALGDLGLDGIGTDNVAEALSGDDANGVAHNANYSYSAGALSVQASTVVGSLNDSFAVGAKYSFGDFYAGLGYNDTDEDGVVATDGTTTSLYAGGNLGGVKVAAMYSTYNPDAAGADVNAWGLTAAYTANAATITVAYSDNELSTTTDASYGVAVSYDLGGGAALKGAVGSVNGMNAADLGVSFSF